MDDAIKKRNAAAMRLRAGNVTLRAVCDYVGLECPEGLSRLLDISAHGVSCGVLTTSKDDIYFYGGDADDAEDKVGKAYERGALCAVVRPSLARRLAGKVPCIAYGRPRAAAMEIARVMHAASAAKTVAVTGSIGKTSTKEMVRLVAESSFNTLCSASNQNGLPQVVRYAQHVPRECEVYIQETGMSKPGSIERDATVLQPDLFFITNIGLNHVGYFENGQQGILNEKLQLDRLASADAVGFVNWDDPLLHDATYAHRVVSFGIDAEDADWRACDIVERNGIVRFVARSRNGESIPVSLNIVGRHNVYNALAALAFGRELGIEGDTIAEALARFRATGVRQHLTELDGYRVYLDCYNASEGAIASVVRTLSTIDPAPGGKRVLVLGDIDDKLGDLTEEVHRRVGRSVAEDSTVDLLFCFGDHMAWAAQEAKAGGLRVLATSDRAQLEDMIRTNVTRDDIVAFKAGQQMLMSLTLDNLFGTRFFFLDGDMVAKALCGSSELGGMRYRLYRDYGAQLVKFHGGRAMGRQANSLLGKVKRKITGLKVTVPGTLDEGQRVRLVGNLAFAKTHVAQVSLGAGVTTIGKRAFYCCKELKKVDLPTTLRFISRGAFEGCELLESIRVPEGVGTIESRAFADCAALTTVSLPESLNTLADDVFTGCPKVRVVCSVDSFAHRWCEEHQVALG